MHLPFNIGIPEIMIVLVVVLLIFGPKALPGFGQSLGKGLKEFLESFGLLAKELKEGLQGKGKDE